MKANRDQTSATSIQPRWRAVSQLGRHALSDSGVGAGASSRDMGGPAAALAASGVGGVGRAIGGSPKEGGSRGGGGRTTAGGALVLVALEGANGNTGAGLRKRAGWMGAVPGAGDFQVAAWIFSVRWGGRGGVVDAPGPAARRAAAKSATEANRSAGRFASARRITASTAAGMG